ncbi:uncharacterized protein [Leuresthes tenuis]|uniref:uncharacterized protein n=1 Tax=Leuresthes tenuis TaxID=355514 RepID=UPI003B509FC2
MASLTEELQRYKEDTGGINMSAVVKTLTAAHPIGKDPLQSNIPFLDRNYPDAYTTHYQANFQRLYTQRAKCYRSSIPAQMDHKDPRQIEDFLTEAMVSYQHHPLPHITRIPRWAKLATNFKIQTDPQEVVDFTTEAQKLRPHAFQPPSTPCRPKLGIKKIEQVEKLPESTNHATFIPHHCSSLVKATVKHKDKNLPSLRGDESHHNFVSHYYDAFQGAWGDGARPVERHTSSVRMGDPMKIVERKTTHAMSFNQPTVCRPPEVKDHLKLSRGNFYKDLWSSTSKEAFCCHKIDPVVLIKRNQNISSMPKGDTDKRRNTERMSVTTNRLFSSYDLNHTHHPVRLPETNLITKSHVQFSPPTLSGQYYTTTAREHYCMKDIHRVRPVKQLQSNIMSGPEYGLNVSTTMTDFLPLKSSKQTPCSSQHTSNLRFPLDKQHFSTTSSEVYTVKPLVLQRPVPNQCSSLSFALK